MSESYAAQVLRVIHDYQHGMGALDDPATAVLQHVSLRADDGTVTRLDACPCARGDETLPRNEFGQVQYESLGGGQYLSSARHTIGDLVRDVVKGE